MTASPIDPIKEELSRAIHHATLHAHDLHDHFPKLLDLLIPPTGDGDKDRPHRALAAEELIRAAISGIAEYDDLSAEALLVLLGLKHDPMLDNSATLQRTLQKRRVEASIILSVSDRTFARRYEGELISALVFEILRIQRGDQERPHAACE